MVVVSTFKNILIILLSANEEYLQWQKLGKSRDPETWEMYPSTVNAYFNPPANEVCSSCNLMTSH